MKYVETSSESSDDEALITIKRKKTDAPKEKETNTTKDTDKSLEGKRTSWLQSNVNNFKYTWFKFKEFGF